MNRSRIKKKRKKQILQIIYVFLFLLIGIYAFSLGYTDEGTYVPVGYFMAQGMRPYLDFFEHHNLFYYVFYVPLFKIFYGPLSQIALRVLSVFFVFFCAYLIYKIVKKNNLGNPHYAALFFLVGYTGLPINFLRNEFFAMLMILLFFYFRNPFLRGLFLTLFGSSSIMFLFVAIVLYVYNFYYYRKTRIDLLKYILGCCLVLILFFLFIYNIPFQTLYWDLVTVNLLIGPLRIYSWYNLVFFSLILSLPYFIFGIWGLVNNIKKNIAINSIILIVGVFAIIVLSSILSGGAQKGKLPSYLPALGVLSIFCGKIQKKGILLSLVGLGLLTIILYTPSAYGINFLKYQFLFHSCVKENAKINYLENNSNLFITRESASYFWMLKKFLNNANVIIEQSSFSNSVIICGQEIEKKDLTCHSEKIVSLKNYCENTRNGYSNLLAYLKNILKEKLDFVIKFS